MPVAGTGVYGNKFWEMPPSELQKVMTKVKFKEMVKGVMVLNHTYYI